MPASPEESAEASSTPSEVRRLILIRHGQSEWNAQGKWQGQADPPLTELGLQQAANAAPALASLAGDTGVAAMAGSTLIRAAETSRILAETLGLGSPVLVPDMIERDAGEYSGLTREQIEERYPGALAEQRWPPGWEPNDDLLHRVTRGIEHIMNTMTGDCLAVVTHGGVIYTVEDSLGVGHERIGNLGARELIITNGEWSLGERADLLAVEDQTVPDQI